MRILLLGEYSNLHATLAEGLRQLGHYVLVVSDGTNIYDYKRDITLYRKSNSPWATFQFLCKLLYVLPKLRGFDIVQLINPDFVALKAERQFPIYNYLRKHNKHMVLGAYGNDWQWVKRGLHDRIFRYGDFNVGDKLRNNAYTLRVIKEWENSAKGELSRYIANDCDAIISCLFEYQASYQDDFPKKTHFVPLPIVPKENINIRLRKPNQPVRFFLGIKRELMEYKGADLCYQALQIAKEKYKDKCEVTIVEDLPFDEYVKTMTQQDAILDQPYAYTPAMNGLEAMSRGLICIGGGEPENYDILGEHELRPIINVHPSVESIYHELEKLILHPDEIPILQQQSIDYTKKHHDYIAVARQYEAIYQSIVKNSATSSLQ